MILELAARKEQEAIEAERALTTTPAPQDIPVPSPQHSDSIPLPDQPAPKRSPASSRDGAFIGPMAPGGASLIPLPPTEKFQHIGPNDPLVFKVLSFFLSCIQLPLYYIDFTILMAVFDVIAVHLFGIDSCFVLQRKSEDGAGDGGEEGKSSSSFVIPPEQEEKYEALKSRVQL